jgi:hypothetical protein
MRLFVRVHESGVCVSLFVSVHSPHLVQHALGIHVLHFDAHTALKHLRFNIHARVLQTTGGRLKLPTLVHTHTEFIHTQRFTNGPMFTNARNI